MATSTASNAWIDPRASIDEDVEIGPFCTIGPHVQIGRGTRLLSSVTVMGRVVIGRDNVFYPGTVIGGEPQDISYAGSDTSVVIGDGNVFRESVTVNRATEKEDGITRIGDRNFLMAGAHVAHDCSLGNHIIIANASLLGGHVQVADHASISGGVAIHHYATVGRYSFISGLAKVLHDVPPYMLCEGHPARPRCINIVALKRNNFSAQDIESLAEAHRLLYRSKVGLHAAQEVLRGKEQLSKPVLELLQFIEGQQDGRHGRGREARRAA